MSGWAVVQTVGEYHPEGDTSRPKTTEFIHWVFSEQKDAQSHADDLLLATGSATVYTVKKVDQDPWTIPALRKQVEK
jgi:hypothetical protein